MSLDPKKRKKILAYNSIFSKEYLHYQDINDVIWLPIFEISL